MDIMTLDYDDSFVIELRGERVRISLLRNKENPDEYALGVDAPRSVAINREEIYLRKKRSQERRER